MERGIERDFLNASRKTSAVIPIRIVKTVCWLLIAPVLIALAGPAGIRTTDYQRELGKIESDLAQAQANSGGTPDDPDAPFKRAYFLFLKASLTGNRRDMAAAGAEFEKVAKGPASSPDFDLLQAAFHLKLHDLEAAKADLYRLAYLDESPKVQTLKGEIDVQEGRYTGAEQIYRALIEKTPTWDTLSRLAWLRWKAGDFEGADGLYREAEDEISAKDMRSYAWVELQRGLLALSRGRHTEAEAHYRQAGQAYSGYWMVRDYRAELLGSERKFDEAIALYRELLACSPRPDLYQALGDLYLYMGQPERARPWHEKALAVYLDSARRGEVQYIHHLATLYADGFRNGAEAVRWARKDVERRRNAATLDALAWALYRDGQYGPALEEMGKALAYGWRDAHLFFHAAMIHLAAGKTEEGKRYLQQAAEINPHYDAFHVHR